MPLDEQATKGEVLIIQSASSLPSAPQVAGEMNSWLHCVVICHGKKEKSFSWQTKNIALANPAALLEILPVHTGNKAEREITAVIYGTLQSM